jgi:hypothetical protein
VPTQYWIDERAKKYQPGVCHPDNWAENQKVGGRGFDCEGLGVVVRGGAE